MGKLQVRYPFINDNKLIAGSFSSANPYDKALMPYFVGNNNIFSRYGSINMYASYNIYGDAIFSFIPSFRSNKKFEYKISAKTGNGAYLKVYHPGNASYGQNMLYYDNTTNTRDYTTIPFYSYETDSTYMFAFDKLNNFLMITERFSIDDQSIKSYSIIARKTCDETEDNPLGFYEWNDSADFTYATYYANLYTEDKLYNASNVGYCSKYSLYQYTRDGFIYPDIYYCDGGLSVPPDGIVRIGTSKFMRLGSNLFLRID